MSDCSGESCVGCVSRTIIPVEWRARTPAYLTTGDNHGLKITIYSFGAKSIGPEGGVFKEN
jgi:hypothetical protein